jgi:hypothetical protein
MEHVAGWKGAVVQLGPVGRHRLCNHVDGSARRARASAAAGSFALLDIFSRGTVAPVLDMRASWVHMGAALLLMLTVAQASAFIAGPCLPELGRSAMASARRPEAVRMALAGKGSLAKAFKKNTGALTVSVEFDRCTQTHRHTDTQTHT